MARSGRSALSHCPSGGSSCPVLLDELRLNSSTVIRRAMLSRRSMRERLVVVDPVPLHQRYHRLDDVPARGVARCRGGEPGLQAGQPAMAVDRHEDGAEDALRADRLDQEGARPRSRRRAAAGSGSRGRSPRRSAACALVRGAAAASPRSASTNRMPALLEQRRAAPPRCRARSTVTPRPSWSRVRSSTARLRSASCSTSACEPAEALDRLGRAHLTTLSCGRRAATAGFWRSLHTR